MRALHRLATLMHPEGPIVGRAHAPRHPVPGAGGGRRSDADRRHRRRRGVGQLALEPRLHRPLAPERPGRARCRPRPARHRQRRADGGLLLRGRPRDPTRAGRRRPARPPHRCAAGGGRRGRHDRSGPHLPGRKRRSRRCPWLGHPHGHRHRVRRRGGVTARPPGAALALRLPPHRGRGRRPRRHRGHRVLLHGVGAGGVARSRRRRRGRALARRAAGLVEPDRVHDRGGRRLVRHPAIGAARHPRRRGPRRGGASSRPGTGRRPCHGATPSVVELRDRARLRAGERRRRPRRRGGRGRARVAGRARRGPGPRDREDRRCGRGRGPGDPHGSGPAPGRHGAAPPARHRHGGRHRLHHVALRHAPRLRLRRARRRGQDRRVRGVDPGCHGWPHDALVRRPPGVKAVPDRPRWRRAAVASRARRARPSPAARRPPRPWCRRPVRGGR